MQRDWLTAFIIAGVGFIAGAIYGGAKMALGVEKHRQELKEKTDASLSSAS